MKLIYFVRHGESMGNAAGTYQGPNVALSPAGEYQARVLAERFSDIPVDIILSSTMARARKTTEIIQEVVRKPTEFSDLLTEVRQPSKLWGKPHNSKESKAVSEALRLEDHEPTWRYSDEENFSDRTGRAGKVIETLLERKEQTIAVVSHGNFIRTVLACMAFGKNITPAEYVKFVRFFHLFNTGISVCDYTEDMYGQHRWKLRHWNDIAHVGE